MSLTATIQAHEAQLRQAMLAGDVGVLERLLADQIVFVGLQGHLLTKQADLEDHRSRTLVLHELTPIAELVQELTPDTVAVTVVMATRGSYAQQPFAGTFRYLRVWLQRAGQWQVVAGSVSLVA